MNSVKFLTISSDALKNYMCAALKVWHNKSRVPIPHNKKKRPSIYTAAAISIFAKIFLKNKCLVKDHQSRTNRWALPSRSIMYVIKMLDWCIPSGCILYIPSSTVRGVYSCVSSNFALTCLESLLPCIHYTLPKKEIWTLLLLFFMLGLSTDDWFNLFFSIVRIDICMRPPPNNNRLYNSQ